MWLWNNYAKQGFIWGGGDLGNPPLTRVSPPKILTCCHDLVMYNIILSELNCLVFSSIHILMKNKCISTIHESIRDSTTGRCSRFTPPPYEKILYESLLSIQSHYVSCYYSDLRSDWIVNVLHSWQYSKAKGLESLILKRRASVSPTNPCNFK